MEQRVVAETQAFFTQIAFYDPVLHPERSATVTAVTAKQQLGETLSMTRSASYGFQRLAESFAMSPDERAAPEGEKVLNSARNWLHSEGHDYGNLIAAGLYQRSKQMSAPERRSFFDELYPSWGRHPETDGKPPLTSILAAGGVRTAQELLGLFQEGADLLLGPAKASSFGPRPRTGGKPASYRSK